ncbi:MAG: protein-glutamate O-methyltransferase CheR [Clostridia bacterium]|nr:protein-glutamate O-methyltransferase CheR [Clostridia bacterium]
MLDISDKEFERLATYMKANYGINMTEKKKTLVMGRLHNVLIQNNFKSFSEYYEYIISDKTGDAVTTLINKLTTNHTFFMRESQHFDYLKKNVLPYLAEKEKSRKDLRIWSAGCSTGEEPYTLAMILSDFFGLEKPQWDTKVLATDISSKVLNAADKGIYSNEHIASLPDYWKRNYFRPHDTENSIVADRIKSEVIFRLFNLMTNYFPFKRQFHVIFCRNVMIYFDAETKRELVNKFYDSTEPGGYLFIGHSESLNRSESGYKYILPAVYRKE